MLSWPLLGHMMNLESLCRFLVVNHSDSHSLFPDSFLFSVVNSEERHGIGRSLPCCWALMTRSRKLGWVGCVGLQPKQVVPPRPIPPPPPPPPPLVVVVVYGKRKSA